MISLEDGRVAYRTGQRAFVFSVNPAAYSFGGKGGDGGGGSVSQKRGVIEDRLYSRIILLL
jgi:hypothetical protein